MAKRDKSRQERLAQALRDNLRRRKAQTRVPEGQAPAKSDDQED